MLIGSTPINSARAKLKYFVIMSIESSFTPPQKNGLFNWLFKDKQSYIKYWFFLLFTTFL